MRNVFATIGSGDLDAVKAMISSNPLSLVMISKVSGDTVLHCAVSSTMPVFHEIARHVPHLKYAKNFAGRTPYAEAVLYDNVEAMHAVYDIHVPDRHENVAMIPDTYGYLPLHHACIHSSVDAVKAVLSVCPPDILTTAVHNGRLPIHMTKRPDVAEYLIQEAPETLMARTEVHGLSPLDIVLCREFTDLIDVYAIPETVCDIRPNGDGTALHLGAQCGNAIVMSTLLSMAPLDIIRMRDGHGCTILHRTCKFDSSFRSNTIDVASVILDADPSMVTIRDVLGHAPLHYALSGFGVLAEKLMDLYPDALDDVTSEGSTPLHEVIKNGLYAMWPFIAASIVRRKPELLHVRDAEGNLAEDYIHKPATIPTDTIGIFFAEALKHAPTSRWDCIPPTCDVLAQALPWVLKRSESEAGRIVKRLSNENVQRIQTALLAIERLQERYGVNFNFIAREIVSQIII